MTQVRGRKGHTDLCECEELTEDQRIHKLADLFLEYLLFQHETKKKPLPASAIKPDAPPTGWDLKFACDDKRE